MRSAVSTAEFIITKAPATEGELCCGGVALVSAGDSVVESSDVEGNVAVGKRYVVEGEQLEVLCTKAGSGELTFNGEVLNVRSSKPLPSSD